MKYLYISILALLSIACTTNDNSTTETSTPQEIVEETFKETYTEPVSDKLIPEEVIEEPVIEVYKVNKDSGFFYFEDFATILTKSELTASFGQENLKDDVSWFAEGTLEKNITTLNDPKTDYKLTYVWEDNDSLAWITARHYIWKSDHIDRHQNLKSITGVNLGMTLQELRDWNEEDFEFSGFGWDFAGGIYREEDSKFNQTGLVLILGEGMDLDYDTFGFILGDVSLKSNENRLNGAGIHLNEITKYID
jgi:hypothetical protein